MALIRLADLLEQKDEDLTGVTTTANIPSYPVPLGMVRKPYPFMGGYEKKPVLMMTYAEYLAWLKKLRNKKEREKNEKPIWPSLLK